MVGADAHLKHRVLVGKHRYWRYFGAGAGGRGHCNHGQDGSGDVRFAVVLVNRTTVAEEQCRGFGEVHVAPAAEADDAIGFHLGRPSVHTAMRRPNVAAISPSESMAPRPKMIRPAVAKPHRA